MAKPKKSAISVTIPAKPVGSTKTKAAKTKPAAKAVVKTPTASRKTDEELMVENLAAMSQLVKSMADTMETLVLKAESMAFHIIAIEEILAELVADNGLNLSRVNARIRLKLSSGSNGTIDASKAIDVAAAIASPLPRR